MATFAKMAARLVDLFGPAGSADPTKLSGNLTVSPAGNVLVGSATDDGTNKFQVTGMAKVTGGVQSNSYATDGYGQFRAISGNYGAMIRNDGLSCYFLSTASGSQTGAFNAYRPFWWNLSSGAVGIATDGSSISFGAYGSFTTTGSFQTSGTTDTTGAFRTTGDIGNSFASWNASRLYAVQIDAPAAGSAYGGIRWTRWGGRHLAGIDAYEGGSAATQPSIVMHVANQNNAWTFNNTDITRGAGGTVYGTWNLTPITTSNIASQSVNYANTAGSVTNGVTLGQINFASVHCGAGGGNVGTQGVNMSWNDGNGDGAGWLACNQGGGSGGWILRTVNVSNTVEIGRYTISGAGVGTNGSDIRLKDNVQTIENALDRIRQIRGVSYNYKSNGEAHYGVIAQEVQPVFPDAVTITHKGDEHEEGNDMLGVSYNDLVGPLIEAVKELADKVDAQSATIASLQAQLVSKQ